MELQQTFTVPVPVDRAWDALRALLYMDGGGVTGHPGHQPDRHPRLHTDGRAGPGAAARAG
jgi:hypothetical protein